MRIIEIFKDLIQRGKNIKNNSIAKYYWESIKFASENKMDKSVVRVPIETIFAGKVYIFEYDAKWKDKLEYWDSYPVVIMLKVDENRKIYRGVNVQWWPREVRKWFIEQYVTLHRDQIQSEIKRKRYDAEGQMPLGVKPDLLWKLFDKKGWGFAYRNYLPQHFISRPILLSHEHITDIINLELPNELPRLVSDIPLSEIRNKFKEYLISKKINKQTNK